MDAKCRISWPILKEINELFTKSLFVAYIVDKWKWWVEKRPFGLFPKGKTS